MSNSFVKGSLLPDEKILATAKFHPIKNWIFPIFFIIPLLIMNIAHTCFGDDIFDYPRKCGEWLTYESNTNPSAYEEWDYYSWEGDYEGNMVRGFKRHNILDKDPFNGLTHKTLEETSLPNMSANKFRAMICGISNNGVIKEHESNCVKVGPWMQLSIVLFWIISIAFVYFVYRFCRWVNSKDEFVITNKRVVAKVGVIRRVAFELHNEQMESIEIRQGIIGRILNFGTLMPCGIGASKVRIPFVVNPFEFRQHFHDLKKPQNS